MKFFDKIFNIFFSFQTNGINSDVKIIKSISSKIKFYQFWPVRISQKNLTLLKIVESKIGEVGLMANY